MKKLILIAPTIVCLCGCAGTTKLAKVLGNQSSILVLNVGTPYGNQNVVSVGGKTTNSILVTPDGKVSINAPK